MKRNEVSLLLSLALNLSDKASEIVVSLITNIMGEIYTWSNEEYGKKHIMGRQDKHLINLDWTTLFPDSYSYVLDRNISDHIAPS